MRSNPKLDVSTGWPKPNIDAKRKVNQAKKREADAHALTEFDEGNQRAQSEQARLNTRYADQWEKLAEPTRLQIADVLLGDGLKAIRKHAALIRIQVFSKADERNIDRLSDLLTFNGGNAA